MVIWAITCAVLTGCADETVVDPDATGVRLSVISSAAGVVHQVEITGRISDEIVFGPGRAPDKPKPFGKEESVVLLVDEALHEQKVDLMVIGFSQELVAVRIGLCQTTIEKKKLVPASVTMAEESCGNGICGIGEDFCQCALDCTGAKCGDELCCPERDEDSCTCPEDCGSFCGDSCCVLDETYCNCEDDCDIHCGDGCCSPSENVNNCPADCS